MAELISDDIEIKNVSDALDLMANCYAKKASRLIIHEKNIVPEFFDLKTGILGDILQKFATYNFRIALVGDYSKFESKNLKNFICESNKTERMLFVSSIEGAKEKLVK
ncbi:MAG: DUF4180 domain-containing protein [Bacteroidales bacterium]